MDNGKNKEWKQQEKRWPNKTKAGKEDGSIYFMLAHAISNW